MATRPWFVIGSILLVTGGFWASPPSLPGQATPPAATEEPGILPAPPQQSALWTPPPTKLPKTVVAAAEQLFQLGLSDPRGCEYREIEVDLRSPGLTRTQWAERVNSTKCHGWVLPAAAGATRYAVCWNGCVWPLLKVGKPIDLPRDIRGRIESDEKNLAAWARQNQKKESDYFSARDKFVRPVLHSNANWVFQYPISAIDVALLLRLGHGELAEKVWAQWLRGVAKNPNDPAIDPLLAFADDWTWTLYDQAWDAHQSAYDARSLVLIRRVVKAWETIEAEEDKLHPKPKKTGLSENASQAWENFHQGLLYSHLEPAKLLLADQERRARDRKAGTSPAATIAICGDAFRLWETLRGRLDRCPDKAARVALLIQHLEEACDPLQENDGNLLAKMLVEEGDAAVEPILKCLESDTRLTRLEPFNIHQQVQHVEIVSVTNLAFNAVEDILQTRLFEPDYSQPSEGNEDLSWEDDDASEPPPRAEASSDQRKMMKIEAIRAFWMRYRGVTLPERWYRQLADDEAPRGWLEAAEAIVSQKAMSRAQWRVAEPEPLPGAPQPRRHMLGESLREKAHPSVAELMARRTQELNEPNAKIDKQLMELTARIEKLQQEYDALQNEPPDDFEAKSRSLQEQIKASKKQRKALAKQRRHKSIPDGCQMALCLADWDSKEALPTLRTQTAACRRAILADRGSINHSSSAGDLYTYVARFTLARAGAGDLQALDSYSEWICGVQPDDSGREWDGHPVVGGWGDVLLEPLWRYHLKASPFLDGATRHVLTSKFSGWNPLVRLTAERPSDSEEPDWVVGPLLTCDIFQGQLAEALTQKKEVGQALVHATDKIELKSNEGWEGETSTVPDDPLCPRPGAKVAFRLCDLCAYRLSQLEGAPRCELYWPEAKRDRAVAACAAYLKRYGQRFRVPNEPFPDTSLVLGPSPFAPRDQEHRVRLAFEDHNQPATCDDVSKGEAVFALDPATANGPRDLEPQVLRIWSLPGLPKSAVWTTLKDSPYLRDEDDKDGNRKKTPAYEQRGTVWQVEELRDGDAWRRYYGFVGRHSIGRAPAEEIEFPWALWGAKPLDAAFDAALILPEGKLHDDSLGGPAHSYRLGVPMPCRLCLRNHTGLDRQLPRLVEPQPGVMPRDWFTFSVELRLVPYNLSDLRTPGLPPPPHDAALAKLPWKPVARKSAASLEPKQPNRPLCPTSRNGTC